MSSLQRHALGWRDLQQPHVDDDDRSMEMFAVVMGYLVVLLLAVIGAVTVVDGWLQ